MYENKRGFTLIEIIVVLASMSILIAVASPSILGYVRKAQDAGLQANTRTPFLEIQTYMLEQMQYFPGAKDNFDALQAYVKEIGTKLYTDVMQNSSILSTQFQHYNLLDIVIYYDGIDTYEKPLTLDPDIKNHYISKIGLLYGDKNVSDKGFTAVYRINEEVRIFHDFAFLSDEKWSVSFS